MSSSYEEYKKNNKWVLDTNPEFIVCTDLFILCISEKVQ